MTVNFLNSLIGKTVEYDFGGSNPLRLNVSDVKRTPWSWTDEDDVEHTTYNYAISENGWSWYTVVENNIEVIA